MGKHRPSPDGVPAAELIFLNTPTADAATDVIEIPTTGSQRSAWIASALVASAVVTGGVAVAPSVAGTEEATATEVPEATEPSPDRQVISEALAAERLGQLSAARASRDADRAEAAKVQAAAEQVAADAEAARAVQEAAEEAARQQEAAAASQAATEAVLTADAPVTTVPVTAAPGSAGQAAVDYAMAQLGEAYVWGATGPNTWDCSGLVQAAYASAGISLPRVSYAQADSGVAVSRDELQPGDLVAFYSPVSHIGIYIGNGQMVHAPHTGDVVKVTDIDYMPITAMRRVA